MGSFLNSGHRGRTEADALPRESVFYTKIQLHYAFHRKSSSANYRPGFKSPERAVLTQVFFWPLAYVGIICSTLTSFSSYLQDWVIKMCSEMQSIRMILIRRLEMFSGVTLTRADYRSGVSPGVSSFVYTKSLNSPIKITWLLHFLDDLELSLD